MHNDTPCTADPDNIHEEIKRYILILISVLILFSNLVVLLLILCNKKFYTPTYIFVASLGVADLFIGCVGIGTIVTRAKEKTLWICLLRICFTTTGCAASVLCLMCIVIDRYIAITRALTYEQIVTKARATFMVALCWVVALILGFAPYCNWTITPYNGYCSIMFIWTPFYTIFVFLLGAIVPFIVTAVIHIVLYMKAKSHIRKIETIEVMFSGPRRSSGPFRISPRQWRSLRTVLAVFGCLLITWLPMMLTTTVHLARGGEDCTMKIIIGTHLLILGFTNSFLNPIIYALLNKDFRGKVKMFLMKGNCSRRLTENRESDGTIESLA